MKTLYETQDVWLASILAYLYGTECLARITDSSRNKSDRVTTYSLACPVEDAKIVADEYATDSDSLIIKPKEFVGRFNWITQKQNAMRRRGDIEWASLDWISGRVG